MNDLTLHTQVTRSLALTLRVTIALLCHIGAACICVYVDPCDNANFPHCRKTIIYNDAIHVS